MLKYVSGNNLKLSKYDSIGRVDTISLNSSISSNDSSIADCSSDAAISPSRSSSSSSIHYVESPKVVVKIFTRVLCTDVEYKTLSIYNHTTCKWIVKTILDKFRLKHRDPKLFYLTLEAWIKQTGIPIRSVMSLEDDACPALLQSCYTQKDLKFTLMMRRGSIVKVYDTCFQHGPLYQSLLISDRTSVYELIQLLLNCCDSNENPRKFALYEICPSRKSERLLNGCELPVSIQSDWPNPDFCMFQLRYGSPELPTLTNKMITPNWRTMISNPNMETTASNKSNVTMSPFSSSVYNFKKNFKNELTFNLSMMNSAHPSRSEVVNSASTTTTVTTATSVVVSNQSNTSSKSDKLLYI
ncbi:hypothetical protein RDWZM_007970 [Blomia tropicalis]|uniref:Ras-associating domain-containing protein n=1 Tax=Blomia tropicalis TaxID=40697 RepID=A0A9Q0LYG3_BLOTA|nr:hypothetical protein RDWZM_007970 [Blomia tropicalis]